MAGTNIISNANKGLNDLKVKERDLACLLQCMDCIHVADDSSFWYVALCFGANSKYNE
jgi:hypothetical protein